MEKYSREEELKKKIEELKQKIKELESKKIPESYTRFETTTIFVYDSDLGMKLPTQGEDFVEHFYTADEQEKMKKEKELKLNILKRKLNEYQRELFKIEENKKENVEAREKEKSEEELKRKKLELQEERKEIEGDLGLLIEYLNDAGFYDLSDDLYCKFRFAYLNIKDEIKLQTSEKELENRDSGLTTKKEYKEIARSVKKLTKSATKLAKKYKEIDKLCRFAYNITDQIQDLKITKLNAHERNIELKKYFTEPVYKSRFNSRDIEESLGYELLAFYRDYNSSYNEALRTRKY